MKNKAILKNIGIILGFILIVSGNVFIQELLNLDEIWIYNFARCMADGLIPYKEISIITTPLFPMICAVFLKIFGSEMIVLRFVEVAETVTILFLIYKILKRLKVNEAISLLVAMRNILFFFRTILFRL